MMRIYKEFTFEAAHFLPSAPAGRPNSSLHGHSFVVRVSVDGEPDPETGLICSLDDFGAKLSALKDRLDHRLLNEVKGLETPTLERMAAWIWHELEPDLPDLAEVQISRPTCREGCIYNGPAKRSEFASD